MGKASLGLGIGAAVVVAAVAIARGSPPAAGPLEIVLTDLRFSPNRLDATVGENLVVRLTNAGSERHDLNFPSLHMPALEGVEAIVAPGESRTIRLRFDKPGVHTFSCSLPGHAASGMTGALFVRP